ncbi:MAG TPA: hypothetical protein VF974_00510 [Patescibacteria group bacterium]
MKAKLSKLITGAILAILIATQVTGGILIAPKTAQAVFPTIDIRWVAERIGIGIARGVLERFTEQFLTRFTNKLVDKYKIRNYLYYDRVLTDYYLNRYIADNITDPDLRDVYSLMERAAITGQPTGTTGGINPSKALIPRLNKAINKAYTNRGGIDPQKIYNPSSFNSDREYFAAAQAYFSNPPSFTEQNLQGEFGAFQSSATSASQLEILAGKGIKNGRIIGGSCKGGIPSNQVTPGIPPGQLPGTVVPLPTPPGGAYNPNMLSPLASILNKLGIIKVASAQAVADPNTSPAACKAGGGEWQASLVDQARSFIDNPTAFIEKNLDAAISQHFNNLYNPSTDFWTQVGKSFGKFIWNQLGLDKTGGVLTDSPNVYAGTDYGDPNATTPAPGQLSPGDIDIDGDGIADAVSYSGTGIIDHCIFGGTPPNNCIGSATILNSGGTLPPAGPPPSGFPPPQPPGSP